MSRLTNRLVPLLSIVLLACASILISGWMFVARAAAEPDQHRVPKAPNIPSSITPTPPTLVEAGLDAMRARFAEEIQEGLQVTETEGTTAVSETLAGASLTAGADDQRISGPLFQRRDIVFRRDVGPAAGTLVTKDLIITRDANEFTYILRIQLAPTVGQRAGSVTDVNGLTVEHRALVVFDDLNALSEAMQGLPDPLKVIDLVTASGSPLVKHFTHRVTVTDSLGRSITFAPGELTFAEAIARVGGSCPSCYDGCFAVPVYRFSR